MCYQVYRLTEVSKLNCDEKKNLFVPCELHFDVVFRMNMELHPGENRWEALTRHDAATFTRDAIVGSSDIPWSCIAQVKSGRSMRTW
jgi:hypothetical protein